MFFPYNGGVKAGLQISTFDFFAVTGGIDNRQEGSAAQVKWGGSDRSIISPYSV